MKYKVRIDSITEHERFKSVSIRKEYDMTAPRKNSSIRFKDLELCFDSMPQDFKPGKKLNIEFSEVED